MGDILISSEKEKRENFNTHNFVDSNILSSDTKELDNEKIKFVKKYKKLEKNLPKILFIEIKKNKFK